MSKSASDTEGMSVKHFMKIGLSVEDTPCPKSNVGMRSVEWNNVLS